MRPQATLILALTLAAPAGAQSAMDSDGDGVLSETEIDAGVLPS
ncbi:hypothetical protein [Jannaschia seohaensis]|uniref:EF hand domain-containing protein n=1 Tax=Jannaschia seohaensis TaxID=475081 RepID=A0A2Y9A6K0_9RHOB|nr:hypothetical protein [Jannaschia seohaensis]PWJ21951.1 hypothetical protein BCF38_101360 [Jannaschia seohaensis]SSA38229.1 hypothetical protein SAMN05421539_101360 [Jannaschia seohaensis]